MVIPQNGGELYSEQCDEFNFSSNKYTSPGTASFAIRHTVYGKAKVESQKHSISHTERKYDHNQKNRTDGQTALTSTDTWTSNRADSNPK